VWQGGDNPLTEVAPGSEVEVLGLTDRAGYSPSILPLTIEVVGTRDLPPAAAFDAELFFAGFQEGKRVVVEGVVQAVREEGTDLGFVVDHYGRRFAIDVAKEQFGDDPESFIDTEVKVQGVAVAIFNQRGEFVWPKLRVTTGSIQ
jgi:hypothetical protein